MVFLAHPQVKMLVKEGGCFVFNLWHPGLTHTFLESFRYLFQSEKHGFKGVYKFGERVKLEKPTSQSFKEHPCYFMGHSPPNSSKIPSLSFVFY